MFHYSNFKGSIFFHLNLTLPITSFKGSTNFTPYLFGNNLYM